MASKKQRLIVLPVTTSEWAKEFEFAIAKYAQVVMIHHLPTDRYWNGPEEIRARVNAAIDEAKKTEVG